MLHGTVTDTSVAAAALCRLSSFIALQTRSSCAFDTGQ